MPRSQSIFSSAVFGSTGLVRRPAKEISPTPGDLELMRIVAIVQYVVGGLTLLLGAAIVPDLDSVNNKAYVALGSTALVLAVVRYFLHGQTTLRHARLSNAAGVLFIAAIVAVSRPIGATPAFYLWPVLTAAYFLRRRDLALIFVGFMVSFAVALWGFTAAEAKAQNYVPVVLVVFVVTALVRLMRESLAALIDDLALSASTDELTGLPNRASFRRSCQRDIDRARRSGAPLSLVLIDLDHFKLVNDRLGHAGGDEVLARFARVLAAECRGGDRPARYGGEEFVVVLAETDLAEAIRFSERLRARVETETAEDPAPFTVSIGVTTLTDAQVDPAGLLHAADEALYAAKAAGRNRVVAAQQPNGSTADH